MNDETIAQTADNLSKLEPGFLPGPIFQQVTRLSTTAIIEIVPLRVQGDKIEVLTHKRPGDDPVWPGKLHTAGTVIRPTDKTYDDAIRRVLTEELDLPDATPTFVTNILHQSGRGNESSLVYWVEVPEPTAGGTFYNADNLPDSFIPSQMDFIPAAVKHFKQSKQL